QRSLSKEGITLRAGMTIRVRGEVDLYRPRGQIGFVVAELDVTSLLGQLAMARAELIQTLKRDGTIGKNAQCLVPDLPLRLGLIASRGTEGCSDFLGQLDRSRFGFEVSFINSVMQGAASATSVVSALRQLSTVVPPLDIIVIVRGGGAKTDLTAFDDELLARTIAATPVAVWTGIGHTGDESIADLAAGRSHITPTACGGALVEHVALIHNEVIEAAQQILSGSATRLRDAEVDVERRRSEVVALSVAVLDGARRSIRASIDRIERAAILSLDRAAERLVHTTRLARANGLDQQLQRGFSITRRQSGHIVRNIQELTAGEVLTTQFATGTVTSTVLTVEEVPVSKETR
ncbi:MAG: exodeoxyribonuclease VII large subunit, partial [Actinomycetota bacterium]